VIGYRKVDNFDDILDFVVTEYQRVQGAVEVACDIETTCLSSWDEGAAIISISFTVRAGGAHVLMLPKPYFCPEGELWSQIRTILTSPKVKIRGANFKFDAVWIAEKWGIECDNFSFDTMLVGSLLDENRSNSLNSHAKIYTRMGGYDDAFNATYDKSRMADVPERDLLAYAGGDTDACYRVAVKMKKDILASPRLASFYATIVHPAARAFEEVERRGVHVDVEAYACLEEDLKNAQERLTSELLDLIPYRVACKYKDNLSLSRAVVLRDVFFSKAGFGLKPLEVTEKTQKPATTMAHLRRLRGEDGTDVAVWVDRLEELNSVSKTLSTFVVGFLKHLKKDGKFHPSYMLYRGGMARGHSGGTVTGRTSATAPAIQTLPKHTKWAGRLRECFSAPEGMKMFQVDFSQGELRIAACLADESTMLQAYRDGIDLHLVTAAGVNGMEVKALLDMKKTDPETFKLMRQRGKAGNFGLLYGMGPRGFQQYAEGSYGVKLSLDDARGTRDAFFKMYPGLASWHVRAIGMAHRAKKIMSPLGRVRHLPDVTNSDSGLRARAERQAINSPVQATLSDLTMWALAEVERQLTGDGVMVTMMTHDSLAGYVPEKSAESAVRKVVSIMETLPIEERFGWQPQIPFTVDAEIGENLGNLVGI